MLKMLLAALGFNAAVINRGRVAWVRVVVRSIIVLLVLLLVGSLANYYWGWKGLSMFFAFAVGVIGIILALRPEGLIYTAELGILSGIASFPETVRQDVRRFLELYVQTAARVLFWKTGILFILGTISIRENPWAVLGLLTAMSIVFFHTVGWNVQPVVGRWMVYSFACLMAIVLLFSLIPRHTWYRLTGADVKGFFASTEAEIGISAIEKAEEEQREEAKRIFLEGIERKVRRGVKLTDMPKADQDLYAELKAERNRRSLGNAVKTWWDNASLLDKAHAKDTPPPPEPVRIVASPVALPVAPPVVAPQPIEMPEWELCVEIKNRYARKDERCSRVNVEFKKYHREIVITEKFGVTTIYQGFQAGEKGEFEGPWSIQERNYTPGYGQFYLKFDPDSPWEYARGEKIHSKECYYITLKRIVLLQDHE